MATAAKTKSPVPQRIDVKKDAKAMPNPLQKNEAGLFKTGFVQFPMKKVTLTGKMGDLSVVLTLDTAGNLERMGTTTDANVVKAFKPRSYFLDTVDGDWLRYVAEVGNVTDVRVADAATTANLRGEIDAFKGREIAGIFAAERAKGDGDVMLLAERLRSEQLTARSVVASNLKAIKAGVDGPKAAKAPKVVLTDEQKTAIAKAKTVKDLAAKAVTVAGNALRSAEKIALQFNLDAETNDMCVAARNEKARVDAILAEAAVAYESLKANNGELVAA